LAIWQAHSEAADVGAMRMDGGPCRLLLLRQDEALGWRELDAAELAFLAALRRGRTLEQAHAAALRCEMPFDLTAAFGRLLAEGSLAGIDSPAETGGSQ